MQAHLKEGGLFSVIAIGWNSLKGDEALCCRLFIDLHMLTLEDAIKNELIFVEVECRALSQSP